MYQLLNNDWDRKKHFVFFQSRSNPRLCVSFFASVKNWLSYRKGKNLRFTDYIYYSALLAANNVKEFRHRIVNLQPVEFNSINAAFTYIPHSCELHCNCISEFSENFSVFSGNIQTARKLADREPTLTPGGGDGQNLIYFSCLKDISFYSMTNPWGDPWTDSVPRIVFGKFNEEGQMPVSVEVLHSFIDGPHLSSFVKNFQATLDSPDIYI